VGCFTSSKRFQLAVPKLDSATSSSSEDLLVIPRSSLLVIPRGSKIEPSGVPFAAAGLSVTHDLRWTL
jgi:hypothetical protein